MKRLRSWMITSTMMGVLLAGCVDGSTTNWPPDWPPPNPDADEFPFDPFVRKWGLGLNTSIPWPMTREYQEPAQEIKKLTAWLHTEGNRILGECGSQQRVEDLAAPEGYLEQISAILHACSFSIFETAESLVAQARNNGTEEEVYQDLFSQAEAAIAEQNSVWRNFTVPGSVTDIEVASELSTHREYVRDSLYGTTTERWQAWHKVMARNGSDFDLNLVLVNTYLAPLAIPLEVEAWTKIIRRYPWSNGTCEHSGIESYAEAANATLERGLELGRKFEYEPHQTTLAVPYGRLNFTFRPQWELANKDRDWIGALRASAMFPWMTAYYENFTQPVLPTPEEAQFLVAKYRSQNRTLVTERWADLGGFLNRSANNGLWFYQPALLAMTLPALEWAFEDVHCTSADETLG